MAIAFIRKAFIILTSAVLFGANTVEARAQESIPDGVDNSKLVYFPPLISQIGGSCAQASYIGYMFTYEMNRLLNRNASESKDNQFSYLYTWNFINGGIDEGSLGTEGLQIAFEGGIATEADFPSQYSSYQFKWTSGYESYLKAIHYRVTKIRTFEVSDRAGIDEVRHYLWNRGEPGKPGSIVTFSSRSSGWTINTHYTGPSVTGYKALLTKLAPDGAHAMTIVGYDDLVEFTAPDGTLTKGAFIVCNTWGDDYYMHDRGRFYLPYYFWEQSDRSANELSHDMVGTDVEYREPKVVFRVKLDYTSRNDLSFRIGVSNKASDQLPVHDYLVPIANYQGGDYPMQGNNASSEIEFAFDFSSYVDHIHDSEEPKFFLTVSRNKRGRQLGSGKMLAFSVYDYREDPSSPKIYVCEDIAGKEIQSGNNIFSIETVAAKTTSYSKVNWLNSSGQPAAAPFVLRTADGKYVKIRFSDYNRQDGTIKMKYVYAPDGSLKFE